MRKLIFFGLIILSLILIGCSKGNITGGAAFDVKQTIKQSCADSDGGKNIDVKGIITVVDENGDDNTHADSCVAGLLIEYYCEDNKPLNQNFRCSGKCLNGACVQE